MTRTLAALSRLPARDYLTLLIVTGTLTFALGFAGAVALIVYGPQQGTGAAVTGAVTDAWPTRGDP